MANQVHAFDAHTPYAELDRQHTLLRTRVAALQTAIAPEAALDGEELLRQVEAVRSSLAMHFSFEERVGTLSLLLSAGAALRAETERLRAEHAGFLATLDRIAFGLRSGSGGANVRGTLSAVLDQLVDHELDEHQLSCSALRSGPMRARLHRG
jgi:hypothetical protein